MKRIIPFLFLLISYAGYSQTRIEGEDYNAGEGVQVVTNVVGYISSGDWVQWPITISQAGLYKFTFRVSCPNSAESAQLKVDGDEVATFYVPNTGSFAAFENLEVEFMLTAGEHSLRWYSLGPNYGPDIDYFEFVLIPLPKVSIGPDTIISRVDTGATASLPLTAIITNKPGISTASIEWREISSEGGTIDGSGEDITLTGLGHGVHFYECVVEDEDGDIGKDTIKITVRYCKGGTKYIFNPFGNTNGGDLYLETPEFMSREHRYRRTYGYPKYTFQEGDTLALNSAFTFGRVELTGFGQFENLGYVPASGCKIVITSSDTNTVKVYKGFDIADCSNWKLTGRMPGDTSTGIRRLNKKSLIEVGNSPDENVYIGLEVTGKFDSIEVDGVRGEKLWYGFRWKTDPAQDIQGIGCDEYFDYPNLICSNIRIHDNVLIGVEGDGFYGSNTDPYGTQDRWFICDGDTTYNSKLPGRQKDVHVYRNVLMDVKLIAIIVGAEHGYNSIWGNYISSIGRELSQSFGSGIAIGSPGKNIHVFDNIVKNTWHYGLFDFGADSIFVYNNIFDSIGYLDMRVHNPDISDEELNSIVSAYNGGQPSFNHITRNGYFLVNTYQGGVTNIVSSTRPTTGLYQKSFSFTNNRLGLCASITNPNGLIYFPSDWGPKEDWKTNNVLCGNTLLSDGTTAPVLRFVYSSQDWPQFSECSPVRLKKYVKFGNRVLTFRPRGS